MMAEVVAVTSERSGTAARQSAAEGNDAGVESQAQGGGDKQHAGSDLESPRRKKRRLRRNDVDAELVVACERRKAAVGSPEPALIDLATTKPAQEVESQSLRHQPSPSFIDLSEESQDAPTEPLARAEPTEIVDVSQPAVQEAESDHDEIVVVSESSASSLEASVSKKDVLPVETWILGDPNSFELTVHLFSLALVHDSELSECQLPYDIILSPGSAAPVDPRADGRDHLLSFILAFSKLPHVTALRRLILADRRQSQDGGGTTASGPTSALQAALDAIDLRMYKLFVYLASDKVVKIRTKFDVLGSVARTQFWVRNPTQAQDSGHFEAQRRLHGSFLAFHGSPAGNFWSILQGGLRNLSGTKHQAHGAARGKGVYTSSLIQESLGYSRRYWQLNPIAKGAAFVTDSPWLASGLQKYVNNVNIVALVEIVNKSKHIRHLDRVWVIQDERDVVVRGLILDAEISGRSTGDITQMLPADLAHFSPKVRARMERPPLPLETRDRVRIDLPLDKPTFKVLEETLRAPFGFKVVHVEQSRFGVEFSVQDTFRSGTAPALVIIGQYPCCSCLGEAPSTQICRHLAHVTMHELQFHPSVSTVSSSRHLEVIWQKEFSRAHYNVVQRAVTAHVRTRTADGKRLRLPKYESRFASNPKAYSSRYRVKRSYLPGAFETGRAEFDYFQSLASDMSQGAVRRSSAHLFEDTDTYRSIWSGPTGSDVKLTPYYRHFHAPEHF